MKGKTTIGEMINLPNSYIHHFYAENYKRSIKAQQNPEGPEAKEIQNQIIQDTFAGQI